MKSIKNNLKSISSNLVHNILLACFAAMVLAACSTTSDPEPELATVKTDKVDSVSYSTARVVSSVVKEGKSAVTGMGIAWGKNSNPTVVSDSSRAFKSFGVGSFTIFLNRLEPGVQYYVRAYATNAAGTAYGNQLSFTTASLPTPTDVDGNVYNTVSFGSQVWMKENLKVSRYRNGDPIPTNLDNPTWGNTTSGAYAIYDNDAANNTTYGKLYNWFAVADPRGLCPAGWHVPSDAEWTTLENFLGGASVAGGKMKSTGTIEAGTGLWQEPNTGATNSSGFTAFPGGNCVSSPGWPFYSIGNYGSWWSSTEFTLYYARMRFLKNDSASSTRAYGNKTGGISVRCLRD
jgi:uncharacterized protein (TIGR02145 family)